jgi:hypothetical protein
MQSLITRLQERGLAYPADNSDVSLAVRKFPGYGELSGKSLEDLRAGERKDERRILQEWGGDGIRRFQCGHRAIDHRMAHRRQGEGFRARRCHSRRVVAPGHRTRGQSPGNDLAPGVRPADFDGELDAIATEAIECGACKRVAPDPAIRDFKGKPMNKSVATQMQATANFWNQYGADEWTDAVVASMKLGGIDHMFFVSGTELAYYQEAVVKAGVKNWPAPKLVTMIHESAALHAAIGAAMVSGKPSAACAHVDVGTLHYGAAIHTAWRANAPVLITAGNAPRAFPGSMRGAQCAGAMAAGATRPERDPAPVHQGRSPYGVPGQSRTDDQPSVATRDERSQGASVHEHAARDCDASVSWQRALSHL